MRKHSTRSRGQSWWAAQMKAYEQSGMTQRTFCEEHGLAYSTFSSWRRRLSRENAVVLAAPRFVEIEIPQPAPRVRVQLGCVSVDFETLPPPAWVAELAAYEVSRC